MVLNPSLCLCDIEVSTSKVDLLVVLPLSLVALIGIKANILLKVQVLNQCAVKLS